MRLRHFLDFWPPYLMLLIFAGAIVWANVKNARERPAELAAAKVQREAREKERKVEGAAEEAVVVSDIEKCSAVTDPVRCERAFRCYQEPEQCVWQFGDEMIIVDSWRDARQLEQEPTEREF